MLLLTSCNNIVLEKVPPTKPVESIKPIENKVVELKPSASSLPVGKNDVSTSDKKETILVASPRPIPSSSNSSPNLIEKIVSPSPKPSLTEEEKIIQKLAETRPPGMTFPSNMPPMGIGSQVLPLPPYSVAYTVPDNVREGTISLIFKDEYKVRYNKEKKIFYSLLGNDLSNINKIMSEYKIDSTFFSRQITEEQAEIEEKRAEVKYGYDEFNALSAYFIEVKDINVKEFVEKIRKDYLVRECNLRENASGG